MSFRIEPVTPEDAPQISPVMMKAFHGIPHWKLLWGGMSLEEIIDANTQRLPQNLINNRDKRRHQKAVDTTTGKVVGYARWVLPDDGSIQWPEAQVLEPSVEDREKYEEAFMAATIDGKIKGLNQEILDEVNVDLDAADEEIMKGGPFLSTCCSCSHE